MTDKENSMAALMAAIEELGGIEEANRQIDELRRKIEAMTPEERCGIQRSAFPDLKELLSAEEIVSLAAVSPGRGLFELERVTFDPNVPSKTVRKIIVEMFRDPRTAPETKAELIWRYNHVPTFHDAVFVDCKDAVPFPLLDSEEGRKYYCKWQMPDYETVRCSSRVFFQRIARISSFDWEKGNVPIPSPVKKAIDEDAPTQLMMALSIAGKHIDARLFSILLHFKKMKILKWLMENDETAKLWLNPRRILFYACANWPFKALTDYVTSIEEEEPGIVASCTDDMGRNLLWYTIYNRIHNQMNARTMWWGARGDALVAVEKLLIRLGANPDTPTKWGVSWRQLKSIRERASWGYDIFINGKQIFFTGLSALSGIPEGGNEWYIKIVQRGTGLAMEWTFPKRLYPVIASVWLRDNGYVKYGDEFVVNFRKEQEKDIWKTAHFRRGADCLFHFEKPNYCSG